MELVRGQMSWWRIFGQVRLKAQIDSSTTNILKRTKTNKTTIVSRM
jgi:hypothetical protein